MKWGDWTPRTALGLTIDIFDIFNRTKEAEIVANKKEEEEYTICLSQNNLPTQPAIAPTQPTVAPTLPTVAPALPTVAPANPVLILIPPTNVTAPSIIVGTATPRTISTPENATMSRAYANIITPKGSHLPKNTLRRAIKPRQEEEELEDSEEEDQSLWSPCAPPESGPSTSTTTNKKTLSPNLGDPLQMTKSRTKTLKVRTDFISLSDRN